jgi:hypothetical protein
VGKTSSRSANESSISDNEVVVAHARWKERG